MRAKPFGVPFGKASSESRAHFTRLPSLNALAFIPFERRFHRNPQVLALGSAYHAHELERSSFGRLGGHTFCKLFTTGNRLSRVHALAAKAGDSDAWVEKIPRAVVRAALRLSDIEVWRDGTTVTHLTGYAKYAVGSTPVGPGSALRRAPTWVRVGFGGHIAGGGPWQSADPQPLTDPPGAMAYGIRFKIGSKGDWMGERLTGFPAPWAYVIFQFSIVMHDITPTLNVAARSSHIPSVLAWAGADNASLQNGLDPTMPMRRNDLMQLDGFLKATDRAAAVPFISTLTGVPPATDPVTIFSMEARL